MWTRLLGTMRDQTHGACVFPLQQRRASEGGKCTRGPRARCRRGRPPGQATLGMIGAASAVALCFALQTSAEGSKAAFPDQVSATRQPRGNRNHAGRGGQEPCLLVVTSGDSPASRPSILNIDSNPKDSGRLLEATCAGWVRKEREISDFLVKACRVGETDCLLQCDVMFSELCQETASTQTEESKTGLGLSPAGPGGQALYSSGQSTPGCGGHPV